MRLAIVHPFLYTRGGAERVVLKIAQHFRAKIFCSIYEPRNTFEEFGDLDIEVLKPGRLRALPSGLPKRVRDAAIAGEQFYRLHLRDYDVVNAQGTPSEWVRNRNAPVVWYAHTPNREAFDLYEWRMSRRNAAERLLYWSFIQPYRVVEHAIVPRIEHVFANSGNTRHRLLKYLGVDAEVLHPGVDCSDFHCSGYGRFFFYPSRITPEKRFEFAIAAFKQFKKRHRGWKLLIAGALMRSRPEHVAYYERIRKMLGTDGEILLNAPNERIADLYARCRAVLYTPVNEDFGIVPLEAFASCKPVIAANEGGPREVVSDGENGFLVANATEMAQRMDLLAARPEEAERMGKHGRNAAERRFSWQHFLSRFDEVCKKLAGA
jgi:glycosyltransferase involved in cell wall biosynthesis